jgi:hypothetical protein
MSERQIHLTCRLVVGLVLTGSIDRKTIPLVFVSPDTEYKKITRVKLNRSVFCMPDQYTNQTVI